ncbi:hypothetical protein LX16_4757 [Stackebrandtia albiflava]|uniref:Uncharacterized protein n=1 Tax=Stackebrandtia albiflava TaxID=406432 RepID=A0A562UQU6_9ACTN|nr:hypothetical protein [Stackebrandtia albiflava]TWJ07974.1 hypothetical protein LX16_4757 [Stackebrandtia albiflava]
MRLIRGFGDALLDRLLPARSAAAGCDPDPWYQHRRIDGILYRRRCLYNGDCTTMCGAWYRP